MHLDMNKDLLRINNYMQLPQITPKHPVSILNPFQARPFECAEFSIFAVRGATRDHISERTFKKDQLEAEIWSF